MPLVDDRWYHLFKCGATSRRLIRATAKGAAASVAFVSMYNSDNALASFIRQLLKQLPVIRVYVGLTTRSARAESAS